VIDVQRTDFIAVPMIGACPALHHRYAPYPDGTNS